MVGRSPKTLASSLSPGTIFSQDFYPRTRKGDGTMSDMDVNVEVSGLIAAGSGTAAVTLTYLIWAIFQHAALQEAAT
jgi:hypothetical protein